MRFTIDSHEMAIIANHFVPIVPYKTNMVTLGVGQRSDVLVYANGSDTDAVWMRSDIDTVCSVSHQPHALAAIYSTSAKVSANPPFYTKIRSFHKYFKKNAVKKKFSNFQ